MSDAHDWTNATGTAPPGGMPAGKTADMPPDVPADVPADMPRHMLGHVLGPAEFLRHARYDHAQPTPALRRWVDRYWSVTWKLPPGRHHVVTTLDDPAIHLTREWGEVRREGTDGAGTWITGPVTRGRFDVTQSGSGGVVGVRFRLGGTTALTASQPAAVRDRTVPAAAWWDHARLADLPVELPDTATGAAPPLDAWLLAHSPRDAPGYADLLAVLELLRDPAVTGTGELERRSGCSRRSLQRMFRRFVGVGPKRMVLRSRVMDAVAALDGRDPRPLAELAPDLGWFDQSHFIRDFRTVTGRTPAQYLRSIDT